MILPSRRKTLEQACETLKLGAAELDALVKRWGDAEGVDDLGATGFHRVLDILILKGFRTRKRPLLSAETHALINDAYAQLGGSKVMMDTDLRRQGVKDVRDLDGLRLMELLIRLEGRGIDLDKFRDLRRAITPGQLKNIGRLRKLCKISDYDYYYYLQSYGGVNTASDLDPRGCRLMTVALEYKSPEPAPAERVDAKLAGRPGFASPRQLALVQALWGEWADAPDEAGMNAWLEHSFGVSALRFLTAGKASQAITALQAMKFRKARGAKAEKGRKAS